MNTKHLVFGFTALVLASCASFESPHRMRPMSSGPVAHCTPGNCTIDVVVDTSGSACTITSPRKRDGVIVPDGVRDVNWEIKTAGYEFVAGTGVSFPGAPGGVFTNPGHGASRNQFKVTDNNDAPERKGVFPYHISVQSADGKITCKLDPYVIND
jgi:hypothetical protein